MKKIERTVVHFQCSVCKTKYISKAQAEKCEKRPNEQSAFKEGDKITAFELRYCQTGRKYRMKGVIRKMSLRVPDAEYEMKWLGGKRERLSSHVWEYLVEYRCPGCKEIQTHPYYAPELKRI